jgi:hypothetical protein
MCPGIPGPELPSIRVDGAGQWERQLKAVLGQLPYLTPTVEDGVGPVAPLTCVWPGSPWDWWLC